MFFRNRKPAKTDPVVSGAPGFTFRNVVNDPNAAELFIYDEIGPDWAGLIGAETVKNALEQIGEVERLVVRINSRGGSIIEASAIYNQLVRFDARVEADVDGIAASSASWVMMAGDEIRMAENGMMMIHDPEAVSIGTAQEHRDRAEVLEKMKGQIVNTYATRTGIEEGKLNEWMTNETWFTAREAEQEGFIDSVTESKSGAVNASSDDFKNAPQWASARMTEPQRGSKYATNSSTKTKGHDMITREQFQEYANANPADVQPYIDQAIKNEQAKHEQALEQARNEAANSAKEQAAKAESERCKELVNAFSDQPENLKHYIENGTDAVTAKAEAFDATKKAEQNAGPDASQGRSAVATDPKDTDQHKERMSDDRRAELLNRTTLGSAAASAKTNN